MQLFEKKEIDFSTPVFKYLLSKDQNGFQLPTSKYLQPITIANLLTHSGGVDERWIDTEVNSVDHLMSIEQV